MYFEINNFDGTNSDIIEIVSSVSELGLLRRSGNKNVKVCLPLSLSIGKLDSTNPFNRKVLSKYCTFDNSFDFISFGNLYISSKSSPDDTLQKVYLLYFLIKNYKI